MKDEFKFRERKWTVPFFVAWILFVVSMFSPVFTPYNLLEGWQCAWIVFQHLWYIPEFTDWEDYYSAAFNLANFGMLFSPVVLRFFPPETRWGRWFLVMMSLFTLHVISWSMLGDHSRDLKYGYYLWVASFVVFTGEWMRQRFLRQMKS